MKQPRSLKSRALQLLAQREQSRVELRRKLLAHALAGADPDTADTADGADTGNAVEDADPETKRAGTEAEVEAVLAWLEANRFLCAERFAESRVNARAGRFGNLRIRHELAQHSAGVAPQIEGYEGAYHAFDSTAPVRFRKDVPNGVHPGQGVHFGGQPQARAASRERLLQFLDNPLRH